MVSKTTILKYVIQTILLSTNYKQKVQVASQLDENERIAEYNARGHNWPPKAKDFIPKTQGWHRMLSRRLSQIDSIADREDKWNALINCVYSGLVAPNFTEYGWGMTRAPQDLVDELRESFHKGLVNNNHNAREGDDRAIESVGGDDNYLPPLFIQESREVTDKALHILKPILESWTGVDLMANNAYGYRVYRRGNIMNMHLDNTVTHVISCILHIDHDPLSKPWPLVIEDFHGNTIEVTLESGDLLLYESSKSYHGRPKPFQGAWYTSLFLHYYPTNWDPDKLILDTHYRIPPTWSTILPPQGGLAGLVVVETSVKEPSCMYQWCALDNATRYAGPARFGHVFTSSGQTSLLKDFDTLPTEL